MIGRGFLVVAVAAAIPALPALPALAAGQYSEVVKGACRNDYKRFCAAYALDDPGLRKCMDQAGPNLSPKCVAALVNAGNVSYSRATQRWGHKLQRVR